MSQLLVFALLLSTLPPAATARPLRAAPAAPVAPSPEETPTPSPTPAASPSPTPTPDKELEEAERATKLAEEKKKKEVAEKDAQEARDARLKALVQPLGAPNNVTVPQGNVQTDAAGWAESQALAQEGARQITMRLARFLCKNPKDIKNAAIPIENLVVYNNGDVAAIELYDSIREQLDYLVKEFEDKHQEALKTLAETDPKAPPPAPPAVDTTDFTGIETAFALPGIATGLVKSVAELLNLFRTDTNFVNQSVTINEDTVVSYIADYLSNDTPGLTEATDDDAGCTQRFYIYYPLYMPPQPPDGVAKACPKIKSIGAVITTITQAKNGATLDIEALGKRIELLTKIGEAVAPKKAKEKAKEAKNKAVAEKKEALKNPKLTKAQKKKLNDEIKALNEEIEALDKEIKDADKAVKAAAGLGDDAPPEQLAAVVKNSAKFDAWKKRLNDLKSKTELLVTTTEQLIIKLNTPEEGTRLTALARLLRAERLKCVMNSPNTYTLRVAVTANGTTKIKKNLFVDAKVRHSARAGLVYQLFDMYGRVVKGSTMQCYIDYQSARGVHDALSGSGVPVVCSSADRVQQN